MSHAIPVAGAVAVVLLDQISKALVVDRLGPGAASHEVAIVGSSIALRYVENTGAAFGLLRGQGFLLTLAAVVILGGLVLYYRRLAASSRATAVAVAAIAGGAVGNLIDRVRLGYVVDFIAVGPWPTFNLADSAITLGVVLLAGQTLVGATRRPADRPPTRLGSTGTGPTLPADG